MDRRWRIEEGPPDPGDVLQDRKALNVHRTVVRVRHRRNYSAPGVFDEHRGLLSLAIPAEDEEQRPAARPVFPAAKGQRGTGARCFRVIPNGEGSSAAGARSSSGGLSGARTRRSTESPLEARSRTGCET